MPTSPGPLLSALDALWERLRGHVPELPPISPVISPTSRILDHGPTRWTRGEDGTVTGLVVNADVIQAGADAVLETVLHDAAHLLCWCRNIDDTTMHGVYHNQNFLTAAEEVGLVWPEGARRVRGKGYHTPVLTPATKKRHAEDLRALDEAIPLILPHLELPLTSNRGRVDRLTLRCQCEPARSFRISRTVAAAGPITCGVCGEPFTER
jgi:predicted SprT family Zn-dependent metalloprotease